MGKAKTPGPDLLAAEFYQTFEDLVIEPLTRVLNEAHSEHCLPTTTKQGIVKIVYKAMRERIRLMCEQRTSA